MRKILCRGDKDFYTVLGPVFGSRKIQRESGDRFYDDENKIWIVSTDGDGVFTVVLSMAEGILKNIYIENSKEAAAILKEIKKDVISGKVPSKYVDTYKSAGYTVEEYTSKFVKIIGDKHE